MATIVSFEKALEKAADYSKKHVLLGNGFSRACRDDIFAYGRLFERAQFDTVSDAAHDAFEILETQDFEVVMRALRQAALLASVYRPSEPQLAQKLEQDARGLRELLVQTIAGSHPDRPSDIPSDQYAACRRFLANFDSVYTLNYDLLLYWACMQSEIPPDVRYDDGFRTPENGQETYVTWDIDKTDRQSVFYLHGALHIFDAGAQLQKFTWVNTGKALVDQIREALNTNRFPLFVAEGSADEKMAKIQHSNFLGRAYRSFAKIGGALFIFGMSMAENDEHILRLIDHGKTKLVAVGLYGDPTSATNQQIISRVDSIRQKRGSGSKLETVFFDAASATVWG